MVVLANKLNFVFPAGANVRIEDLQLFLHVGLHLGVCHEECCSGHLKIPSGQVGHPYQYITLVTT